MYLRILYCKWPSDRAHHFVSAAFHYKVMALGIKYAVSSWRDILRNYKQSVLKIKLFSYSKFRRCSVELTVSFTDLDAFS